MKSVAAFRFFAMTALWLLCLENGHCQERKTPITYYEVLSMVKQRLPDETVLAMITDNGCGFSISTQALATLGEAGASRAMLQTLEQRCQSWVDLKVVSSPPGAAVFVDGPYAGVTPMTLRLKPGKYVFVFLHPECETKVGNVLLEAKPALLLQVALTKKTGK